MKTMRELVEDKVMELFREGYEEGLEAFHEPVKVTDIERRILAYPHPRVIVINPGHLEALFTMIEARVKCAYDAELLKVLDAQLCQAYR